MAQNLCFPMGLLVFFMKGGFHFLSCAHCYGPKPMFSYGFTCVLHEKGVAFFSVQNVTDGANEHTVLETVALSPFPFDY